jgi:hypothetical protein
MVVAVVSNQAYSIVQYWAVNILKFISYNIESRWAYVEHDAGVSYDTVSSEWRKSQIHISEIHLFVSTNLLMPYRFKHLSFYISHSILSKSTAFQVLCVRNIYFLMHMFTSIIPLSFLELVPLPLCYLLHPSGPLCSPFHSTLSFFCQKMVHCDLRALCSKPVNIRVCVVCHIHTNGTVEYLL